MSGRHTGDPDAGHPDAGDGDTRDTDVGLAPLRADEWGEAEYDAYGSLLGIPGEKVPRVGSGHRYDPLNFAVVGTFMHHPELAKHFLAFNNYQLQRGSLPVRWRRGPHCS